MICNGPGISTGNEVMGTQKERRTFKEGGTVLKSIAVGN
jgi:hypothetical protein